MLGFSLLILFMAGLYGWLRWSPYAQLDTFLERPHSLDLLDRNGRLLRTIHPDEGVYRRWVDFELLPRHVVRAVVEAEDSRFFFHPGFDVLAVLRAAWQNRQAGRVISGASTISMQLSRIISPHAGGMKGKLLELWNALRLETRLTKQEILEQYINAVPYGGGRQGIESAARAYFGCEAKELNPRQAVLLAVMPRRPTDLNPHRQPERLIKTALPLAKRVGINVGDAVADLVALRELLWNEIAIGRRRAEAALPPFEAPHFTDYVAQRLTPEQLRAGLPLRTTLDLEMQNRLETSLQNFLEEAKESRVNNGAAVVLENDSGAIRAYVGSPDFFDRQNGGMIDGVQIRRQPGSTLKPFLYMLALENGFTASSILPDLPQDFGSYEAYIPQNFSQRFAGPVRLRVALASSLNVPAVYTVVRLGVQNFADRLIELGFESVFEQRNQVGAGIALGNVEVRLFELTRAFTIFARHGSLPGIKVLEDETEQASSSEKTWSNNQNPTREFDRAAAQIIHNILGDSSSRVPGFGFDSVLNTTFPSIAKTGTANQFSNIWALVSSPSYTVGVWMGNIHGQTVVGRTGSSLPARLAVDFLQEYQGDRKQFLPLTELHQVRVSPISGMRCPEGGASSNSGTIQELFRTGKYPPYDTWNSCGAGPVQYPPEYQDWAQNTRGYQNGNVGFLTQISGDEVRILSPNDGAQFYFDPYINDQNQAVVIRAVGNGFVKLFWNGELFAEGQSPLRASVPLQAGRHYIRAVCGSAQQNISIQVGAE